MRVTGRIVEALAILDRMERDHPRFSRVYEERGQCLMARREHKAAENCFLQAVSLNPTLLLSWELLADVYQITGNAVAVARVREKIAILEKLPKPVLQASGFMADGDLPRAASTLRAYLKQDSRNVGALRMLARVHFEMGDWAEAEILLEIVIRLAPDFQDARLDYAMALLQGQKHARARAEAVDLLTLDQENREYLKLFCAASIGLGDHEPVIDIYEKLLSGIDAQSPEAAELLLWRGNALKTIGRTTEAISNYQAAIRISPLSGVAWFSLANLKVYRFSTTELEHLKLAEARSTTSPIDRIYLCFALAKGLEDAGQYETSWTYYERGNALQKTRVNYRKGELDLTIRSLKMTCDAAFFNSRQGWGAQKIGPIFIVGLPRSGSTLLEQILASHPDIEGTSELNELSQCAADVDEIQNLSEASARQLGERYISETAVYRSLNTTYFIDKMPNNFLHIGLIQLILPNAKIIDVRRDPMACCVANLKQLFGSTNQPYAYSTQDIAHYYQAYVSLMEHWETVLPGRVLRVRYEDLVEDLEGCVRKILDFCALPFDASCLSFYENERSVRTASALQVRRPLTREGIEQWKHFEPWLNSLKSCLNAKDSGILG